ncbi:hypothetical protein, partial [Oleiphilus sp. HI0080]
MNDFYTRIAQSDIGKSIFDGIGLPSPPKLKRSPEVSLEQPRGRILVAGALNATAMRRTLSELSSTDANISMPFWDEASSAALFSKHNAASQKKIEQISFNQVSN